MANDVSLIPQQRIENLNSSLTTLQTNINNVDTNAVHKTGNESINGTKTFNTEIKAELSSYSAVNSATNTTPYFKLADFTLTGTYNSRKIPFVYSRTDVNTNSAAYLGEIILRTNDTAGTIGGETRICLTNYPIWIYNSDFELFILYKNNTPNDNQVNVQLWVKVRSTYAGIVIIPLRKGLGGNSYNVNEGTWYSGVCNVETLPTDYTRINCTYQLQYVVTPTEDTTSSRQIDTVGARNTKLSGYALDSTVIHKSSTYYDSSTSTLYIG